MFIPAMLWISCTKTSAEVVEGVSDIAMRRTTRMILAENEATSGILLIRFDS
jgi:hypothetical protein